MKIFPFKFIYIVLKDLFMFLVKSFQLRRGSVMFSKVPPPNLCPLTLNGKVYCAEMSVTDIRLISSVCNDNQTFLVEYTPYDNLQIVKRALEQCHEARRKKPSHLLLGVRIMAFKIFLRI
jgi:hypothetical protein